MFGSKRGLRKYNSRIYECENTKDFIEFNRLVDTINDFDFAIGDSRIVYNSDYSRATIHVETKDKVIETWLIKHGFKR